MSQMRAGRVRARGPRPLKSAICNLKSGGPPGRALPFFTLLAVSIVVFAGTAAGQQTRPVTTSEAGRILHFPKNRSLGWLYTQDAGLRREIESFYHWVDGVTAEWKKIGDARGDVTIPAGQRVQLIVTPEGWKDLSPLAKLAPDDLYALSFMGTGLSPEATEERGYLPRATAIAGDQVMTHVTRLTGLKILDLHTTEIAAAGLRYIERMKSLECLFVPQKMNDAGMSHVAKVTGLKRLYFKQNNVTNRGLARLAELRELEELELGGRQINNDGLVHVSKLPKLKYLMLWGDGFTNAGMVHVKEIRSLRTFHPVSSMRFGDEGLAQLSSLPNLERLTVNGRREIGDAGMAHIAKMKSLRQLDVTGADLSDVGAEHLQRLENLESLHLSDSLSRPALVALLATKPHLRDLRCSGSSNSTYGDEVLDQVGKMADMEDLFACGTQVSDKGMAFLTKCPKLKKLSLFGCPITNQGLAEIGKLTHLEELTTYRAKFTTSGLKQLNGLSKLREMRVSTVEADDNLMDISGLTSLRRLTLSEMPHKGRQLRDDDLACLANLKQLESLAPGYSFTDAGLAHVAGLTRVTRLSIGGPEVTDQGLAHLSGMKDLQHLTIKGNFTDKGVLRLDRFRSLAMLFLICPEKPSEETFTKLTQRTPLLSYIEYGPDLQKMRPIGVVRGMPAGGFNGGASWRW
jgi:Leucine-rich repeat (LRR) protein